MQDIPRVPIDEARLRETIDRLIQWKELRSQNEVLRSALDQLQMLQQKEREISVRELNVEKEKTTLASDRLKLAEDQRDFYKSALAVRDKRPGLGCHLKKFFSLGLARCAP